MEKEKIHYKETQFGFEYGSLKIERLGKNIQTPGDVIIGLSTPKIGEFGIQIRVTKTGKVTLIEKVRRSIMNDESRTTIEIDGDVYVRKEIFDKTLYALKSILEIEPKFGLDPNAIVGDSNGVD